MALTEYLEGYYFGNLMKREMVWKYPNASVLKFQKKPMAVFRPGPGGKRGEIKGFSKAAARRMRKSCVRAPERFTHFVTITFPREIARRAEFEAEAGSRDPSELWAVVVRTFWKRIAIKAKRAGAIYLWAREPQRDGVPHYHVLTTDGEWLRSAAVSVIREWCTALEWANVGEFVEKGYIDRKGNKKAGVQAKPITGGFGGAMRYMHKLCGYMAKKSHLIEEKMENYRHWGRNYTDGVPRRMESSNPIRDYLRRIFEKFAPGQWPLEIQLPDDVACHAKEIPSPIPADLWGYAFAV